MNELWRSDTYKMTLRTQSQEPNNTFTHFLKNYKDKPVTLHLKGDIVIKALLIHNSDRGLIIVERETPPQTLYIRLHAIEMITTT